MTAAVPQRAGLRGDPTSGRRRGLRTDIQGLRAVAVLLVLGYHAGLPFLPGGYVGVDVFFVISGYLITSLILREIETTGRLDLRRFYARRARRLLPATAVVLLSVTAITILVLPVTRWASIVGDMVASTLYVMNWRLAERSVEYLAQDSAPSPLQHFWSLAVEEQFYLVWPLLIVLLTVRTGRSGSGPSTRRLTVGLMAILVPSLTWSVHQTATEPGPAYFATTTRLWELALGALLAVGARRATGVPRTVRVALAWSGLGAIAWAALTYTASTPFPGTAALLPTLGTLAVLLAGTGGPAPRLAVLDHDLMQAVGALSYSLYLWHWPLLVGATALWAGPGGALGWPTGLAVGVASVVPAWLTYRVVEKPLHEARSLAVPWRAGVVGLTCVVLGLGGGAAIHAATPAAVPQADVRTDTAPGAAVLGTDRPTQARIVHASPAMTPSAVGAAEDVASLAGRHCNGSQEEETMTRCSFGPADAETVVAVVGDSKMHQWLTALEPIASRQGWRLETYLKSACPLVLTTVTADDARYEECATVNQLRLDAITTDPDIDVVLTSQVAGSVWVEPGSGDDGEALMRAELREVWEDLRRHGKEVVVVANNPAPAVDMMDCVAQHEDSLDECAFTPRGLPPATEEAEEAGIPVVDLVPWICPVGRCPAVIGDVMVYRQGSHLTATYVRTLVPVLERQLAAQGLP